MTAIHLILIQIITFFVIIMVLRFLFDSHLKTALSRLQALHQENLEKEEVLNKELERARTQVQSEIARSQEEAKNIIEEARQNAEKISLQAQESAAVEAKKILAEAGVKIRKMENDCLAGAEEKAVSLAQDILCHTFTPKGQEILHRQLIEELIGELDKVDKSRLAVKVPRAELVTPLALSEAEKKRLKDILVSKLGYDLTLEEKIDTALITGILIRLGGLVIDGSLKNKLNKVMNALHLRKA